MKKNILALKTYAEADRFVATADLSKYDFSGFKALKRNCVAPGLVAPTRIPDS